jgi:hypothetical protein
MAGKGNRKLIRIFNSFEEAEDENAREMASIDGATHIANVTARLLMMYPEEFKKPMVKRIVFKKPWTS